MMLTGGLDDKSERRTGLMVGSSIGRNVVSITLTGMWADVEMLRRWNVVPSGRVYIVVGIGR
jgi:hypothetical protein